MAVADVVCVLPGLVVATSDHHEGENGEQDECQMLDLHVVSFVELSVLSPTRCLETGRVASRPTEDRPQRARGHSRAEARSGLTQVCRDGRPSAGPHVW